MLDPNAVTRMVEEQITKLVNEQVMAVFSSNAWLQPLEEKIIQFTQDRILGKFANSGAVPEIVEAVKTSVSELFAQGLIPGVEQYVNNVDIISAVTQAVQSTIDNIIENLGNDKEWQEKIQTHVTNSMVQRTVAGLSAIDVGQVIRQRVDETLSGLANDVRSQLSKTGIQDQATKCELTVMNDHVVVENKFTAREIEAVGGLRVKDLAVTGSINLENPSWQTISQDVAKKTLNQLSDDWQDKLTNQVSDKIRRHGITFDQIRLDGKVVIEGNQLTPLITQSGLQTVGTLVNLSVKGEAYINNHTFNVLNKRVGVNTMEPEMALSVWDEEISMLAGKLKANTAFIGTGRKQNLTLGVNREPALEIDTDGLTAIKKLRIGLHKISHSNDLPGWSGTKGDIVFNANPSTGSNVFAWQCLGGHKWKVIKSVE